MLTAALLNALAPKSFASMEFVDHDRDHCLARLMEMETCRRPISGSGCWIEAEIGSFMEQVCPPTRGGYWDCHPEAWTSSHGAPSVHQPRADVLVPMPEWHQLSCTMFVREFFFYYF